MTGTAHPSHIAWLRVVLRGRRGAARFAPHGRQCSSRSRYPQRIRCSRETRADRHRRWHIRVFPLALRCTRHPGPHFLRSPELRRPSGECSRPVLLPISHPPESTRPNPASTRHCFRVSIAHGNPNGMDGCPTVREHGHPLHFSMRLHAFRPCGACRQPQKRNNHRAYRCGNSPSPAQGFRPSCPAECAWPVLR